MWAAGRGQMAIVKFLVEETTVKVNTTDIVSHVLSAKQFEFTVCMLWS